MTKHEREILMDVERLILDLPCGVDEDADEDETNPEDAIAHVGGLILRRLRELLYSGGKR